MVELFSIAYRNTENNAREKKKYGKIGDKIHFHYFEIDV